MNTQTWILYVIIAPHLSHVIARLNNRMITIYNTALYINIWMIPANISRCTSITLPVNSFVRPRFHSPVLSFCHPSVHDTLELMPYIPWDIEKLYKYHPHIETVKTMAMQNESTKVRYRK